MNAYPLFPRTPMGDRMVADLPDPPLDPPDEVHHFCSECGCGYDEHRRVGEYPRYEYRCPEPPEGRWVGHWPESE